MSANNKKEKVLKSYTMKIGAQSYVFHDIPLDKNPVGRWTINFGKIQSLMKAVAALILADLDKELSFDELEHLAKVAEMRMIAIAKLIHVDRSTITLWKNKGRVPLAQSYCLKDKLAGIIFDNAEKRKRDPVDRSNYWLKETHLPVPKAA